MITKNTTFPHSTDTLTGTFHLAHPDATPTVLLLHGAGKSTRHRADYLAHSLCQHGISSFSFDFVGHGDSTGQLSTSSLEHRKQQTLTAIQHAQMTDPLTIVGSSMGGHIALSLLDQPQLDIAHLILCCPAVYNRHAQHLAFDDGFTDCIRAPQSRRNSHIRELLEDYIGTLTCFIGDQDQVIPSEVITLLQQYSSNASHQSFHTLPGISHQLHAHLANHPQQAQQLVQAIPGGSQPLPSSSQ